MTSKLVTNGLLKYKLEPKKKHILCRAPYIYSYCNLLVDYNVDFTIVENFNVAVFWGFSGMLDTSTALLSYSNTAAMFSDPSSIFYTRWLSNK